MHRRLLLTLAVISALALLALAATAHASKPPINATTLHKTPLIIVPLPEKTAWEGKPALAYYTLPARAPTEHPWVQRILALKPQYETVPSNKTIVLLYYDGEEYVVGQNMTINLLALNQQGPIANLPLTVTIHAGDSEEVYNVTTDANGLARITIRIPEIGDIWVDVSSPQTLIEVHHIGWHHIHGDVYVDSEPTEALGVEDGKVKIVFAAYQANGSGLTGELPISADVKIYFKNGSIKYYWDVKVNATCTSGLCYALIPLPEGASENSFSALVVRAYYVYETERAVHRKWIGEYWYGNRVYVRPLVGWGNFVPVKGVLMVGFVASYSDGRVFNGKINATIRYWIIYPNGTEAEWRKDVELNFVNGFAEIDVPINETIRAVDVWPWSTAIDSAGTLWAADTRGAHFWRYIPPQPAPQPPTPAPTPAPKLELYVGDYTRCTSAGCDLVFRAQVVYNDTPIAGVPVRFYIPWSGYKNGVAIVSTDNNGVAEINLSSILSGFTSEESIADAAVKMPVHVVVVVSFNNETVYDTIYVWPCDILHAVLSMDLKPGMAEYTVRGVPQIIRMLPPSILAVKERDNLFDWWPARILNITVVEPGSIQPGETITLTYDNSSLKYNIEVFSIMHSMRCGSISGGIILWPYYVYASATNCYANSTMMVEGRVGYSGSGNISLEDWNVYIGVMFDEGDESVVASVKSNATGYFAAEFATPPYESYVHGMAVAVAPNGFMSFSDYIWCHISGEKPPAPAPQPAPQPQPPAPAPSPSPTPALPPASNVTAVPVGGTLVVPGEAAGHSSVLGGGIVIAALAAAAVAAAVLAARRRR